MKEVNPLQYLCTENFYAVLRGYNPRLTREAVREIFAGEEVQGSGSPVLVGDRFRKYAGVMAYYKTFSEDVLHRYSEEERDLVNAFRNKVCECLCDSPISPINEGACRYRKLSGRASKFLLGLGRPSESLVIEYREELRNRVEASERVQLNFSDADGEPAFESLEVPVYEELLSVPINGKSEYFYLVAGREFFVVLHQRAPKRGEGEYTFKGLIPELINLTYVKGSEMTYDESYVNPEGKVVFDVEALLVNLWLAERTGVCINGKEPVAERRDMERQCELGHYKAMKQSVCYNYVHITDEGWRSYTDANEALGGREATCTKASWYVRPHYACREDKVFMVKGHYAYRKCSPVTEPTKPVVDYIV